MSELALLGALVNDRAAYDKLERVLSKDDFTDRAWVIVEHVADYYKCDPGARRVDREIIKGFIQRAMPKHADSLCEVVDRIPDTSGLNAARAWIDFRKESLNQRLGQALVGGQEPQELIEEWMKFREVEDVAEEEEVIIGMSLGDVMKYYTRENLIRLHPPALNDKLEGGVPPGTNIIVFALPETGKSAFAISNACGMAHDGRKVLYYQNEDPHPAMLTRIFSRFTGMTRQQLQDPEMHARAQELAVERGYNNIIFAPAAPGSFGHLSQLIERHEPDVVIIDQLHNLTTRRNLSKVEKLEALATASRETGKKYGTVMLSITQAGDSASNKSVLDMNDVYYSNVAVQQAADLMVGIGMSREDEAAGRRFLSLCKNKITGSHDPVMVNIQPHVSRIY